VPGKPRLSPFLIIEVRLSTLNIKGFEGAQEIYKDAGKPTVSNTMFRVHFRLKAAHQSHIQVLVDKSIHKPHFKFQYFSISTMASRKIVLVTGGNNGIGYETVKALLESQKPYHVLMGSRSVEKAQTAIENLKAEVPETSNTVEMLQVDLTSDESIEKAFEEVKGKHGYLDVLINNAGM
jgi:FlaA1/EpsC-like NDP-sugar epimerase